MDDAVPRSQDSLITMFHSIGTVLELNDNSGSGVPAAVATRNSLILSQKKLLPNRYDDKSTATLTMHLRKSSRPHNPDPPTI